MKAKKTVVLLGKGSLAIQILRWFLENSDQYEIKSVVPSIPEPTWDVSLSAFCKSNGISLVESGLIKDIPDVKDANWSVDLSFSVFYSRIIKKWFIEKSGRILNLHNSPLPKYRGVRPINWALKNSEVEHGVTIHEITQGIDDGPLVAQLKYSIYPEFEEVRDVYEKALFYGYALFQKTMPILDKIVPREQDHDESSYYSYQQANQLGDRANWDRRSSERGEKL